MQPARIFCRDFLTQGVQGRPEGQVSPMPVLGVQFKHDVLQLVIGLVHGAIKHIQTGHGYPPVGHFFR
jgi:hypothetical protein